VYFTATETNLCEFTAEHCVEFSWDYKTDINSTMDQTQAYTAKIRQMI